MEKLPARSFPLSSSFIEAKNQLSDSHAWVMLAEIVFGPLPEDIMRLCGTNTDLVWNGQTWVAFPFIVETIKEGSRGEVQKVTAKVSNLNGAAQYHAEKNKGGIGSTITFYAVYTGDLSETIDIPRFSFEVMGCHCDRQWVTFTLGAPSPYRKLDPPDKMLKNFCRFNFGNAIDDRCPYVGTTFTTCNHTFADCIERNGVDSKYCGIFPMLGENAIYV